MTDWLFLEPLDVLQIRGNRLFGAAGSYGEALMPPWPSLVSGALRSRILAAHAADLGAFLHAGDLGAAQAVLGTYHAPGTFRLAALLGARRVGNDIEPLLPLPADLVAGDNGVHYLHPAAIPSVRTSAALPISAVLAASPGKSEGGQWLTARGIAAWLDRRPIAADHLVCGARLWRRDPRVGIARDSATGTAAEGALFTTEGVAPSPAWHGRDGVGAFGFLAGIAGADAVLPRSGLVRLGGDGRAAVLRPAVSPPARDLQQLARSGRFRLALLTPGLFAGGWRLPGLADDFTWKPGGAFRARLCAAVIPRAQVVSGWDLAQGRPKPAYRAVPAGSVYWFDSFEGSEADLAHLLAHGLPCDLPQTEAAQRRAEGFNACWLAAWPEEASENTPEKTHVRS